MKFRRAFIIIINILLALCMIALFILTIIGYTKYKDVNTLVGNYFTIAFGVVLGVLALAALIAVCAMCLSNTDSYCCCFFYCFLALLIGLIFLGIGIASFVAIPMVLGNNCTSSSLFKDIQTFSELSQNSICTTCPCYFPTSVIQSTYTTQQIILLTPRIPLANSLNSSLPVKAQNCTGWNNNQLTNGYTMFAFLQSNFKCTGWCSNTSSLFYRFTNVSNGIPQKTCYNALVDATNSAKQIIGIPAIVIGSLYLLSILAFFFICCKDKQQAPSGLQQTVVSIANMNDMNRMPQLTQQAFNTTPYYNTAAGSASYREPYEAKPYAGFY